MDVGREGGKMFSLPSDPFIPSLPAQLQREDADAMLQMDGDFLVRESTQSRGQFVLSALQQGQFKHLLLVDPSGRVRTKDMTFDSVSHLINYHIRARIPIISRGSRVLLGDPIARQAALHDNYDTFSRYH